MNQTPKPETVLRRAIASALRQVRVALPGRIEAYDAARCEADVLPLVMEAQGQADGSVATVPLTVVPHCPVLFVGGGGARLTFPVKRGDFCLLLFSSSSLDRWQAFCTGDPVDPKDDRHHHISDGIALVGLESAHTVAPAHASATVLEGDDVRIGDASAVALSKNADVSTLVNVLKTWVTAPGDGGAALKAAVIAAFPSLPVGTTKVKGT